MRVPSVILFLLGVIAAGCATGPSGNGARRGPESAPVSRSSDGPGDAEQKGPAVIETPEIIRILENDRIRSVSTTHSQAIYIQLQDGRKYRGVYVHAQAGKHSDDDQLYDILNLVLHIKKSRPPGEVKDWIIACE